MQVDSGVADIGMPHQVLQGGQIHASFELMGRIGVPQTVRRNLFPDAGTFGGLLAGMPHHLRGDRHVSPPVIHGAGK